MQSTDGMSSSFFKNTFYSLFLTLAGNFFLSAETAINSHFSRDGRHENTRTEAQFLCLLLTTAARDLAVSYTWSGNHVTPGCHVAIRHQVRGCGQQREGLRRTFPCEVENKVRRNLLGLLYNTRNASRSFLSLKTCHRWLLWLTIILKYETEVRYVREGVKERERNDEGRRGEVQWRWFNVRI